MPNSSELQAGAKIGRYECAQRLGRCSFGELYVLKFQVEKESVLALGRLLRPEPIWDEDVAPSAGEAAWDSMEIQHERVLRPADVVFDGDLVLLVSDYVEGHTLRTLLDLTIEAGTPLPVDVALRIAIDVLVAIDAIHEGGALLGSEYAFGGVAPEALFVSTRGHTLAFDALVAGAIARCGGAKYFAAPEQDAGTVDQRSDVFAIGCLVWELLSNRDLPRNVKGPTAEARQPVPALDLKKRGPSDVSPGLAEIIQRATRTAPEQRFRSLRQMMNAIESAGTKIADEKGVAAFVEHLASSHLHRQRQATENSTIASLAVLFGPKRTSDRPAPRARRAAAETARAKPTPGAGAAKVDFPKPEGFRSSPENAKPTRAEQVPAAPKPAPAPAPAPAASPVRGKLDPSLADKNRETAAPAPQATRPVRPDSAPRNEKPAPPAAAVSPAIGSAPRPGKVEPARMKSIGPAVAAGAPARPQNTLLGLNAAAIAASATPPLAPAAQLGVPPVPNAPGLPGPKVGAPLAATSPMIGTGADALPPLPALAPPPRYSAAVSMLDLGQQGAQRAKVATHGVAETMPFDDDLRELSEFVGDRYSEFEVDPLGDEPTRADMRFDQLMSRPGAAQRAGSPASASPADASSANESPAQASPRAAPPVVRSTTPTLMMEPAPQPTWQEARPEQRAGAPHTIPGLSATQAMLQAHSALAHLPLKHPTNPRPTPEQGWTSPETAAPWQQAPAVVQVVDAPAPFPQRPKQAPAKLARPRSERRRVLALTLTLVALSMALVFVGAKLLWPSDESAQSAANERDVPSSESPGETEARGAANPPAEKPSAANPPSSAPGVASAEATGVAEPPTSPTTEVGAVAPSAEPVPEPTPEELAANGTETGAETDPVPEEKPSAPPKRRVTTPKKKKKKQFVPSEL